MAALFLFRPLACRTANRLQPGHPPAHLEGPFRLSSRKRQGLRRSLSQDLKADGWVSEPPRVATREQVLAS